MSLLNNIIVDYGDTEGFAMFPSILTKGIYATAETPVEGISQDISLEIGASGNINFMVNGGFNANTTHNLEFRSVDDILTIEATNDQIMELLAGDDEKTILLGDLTVKSTPTYQSITTKINTKLFVSSNKEIILDSKVQVVSDLKIGGNVFSKELNITHADSGIDYGYAFRVDGVSKALELVKYSSNATVNTCQLVATFGQGGYIDDSSDRAVNEYGSSSGLSASSGNGTVQTGSYTPTTTTGGIFDLEHLNVSDSITTSNLTITGDFGISSFFFEDLGDNGHMWDGHASNLFGISEYITSLNLAVNGSGVATSGTVSGVGVVSGEGEVSGNLIPSIGNLYDLGSSERPWKSLYVGSQTIHIGTSVTIGEDISGDMTVSGGSLKPENIVFSDGSAMGSMTDVILTVQNTTSEKYGDFDTISYTTYINGNLKIVQNFEGSYTYGNNSYDVALSGGNWSVYNYESDVIAIKYDGSGVDLSGQVSFSGTKPNNVRIESLYVYQKTKTILYDNLLFCSTGNTNINETFFLRTMDPFSHAFKNKAKIDFHNFTNVEKLETGLVVNNQQMYSDKALTNEYIEVNRLDPTGIGKQTSKIFTIQFMTFFRAPIYDDYFLDSSIHKYLVPSSMSDRLNKVYELNTNIDSDTYYLTYQLIELNPNYGLYPRLQLQKWDNSVNQTNFSDIIVDDNVHGWGTLDEVWTTFKNKGWLLKLFELTYMYIAHGDVNFQDQYETVDSKNTLISTLRFRFNRLRSQHITFVNDTNDTNDIYNNVICFKKSAFGTWINDI
jgi:hypothetical protein